MPFVYPRRPYSLIELKTMTIEDVLNKCSGIVIDKKSLMDNLDLFLNYSSIIRIRFILSMDYESVLVLEELKEKKLFQKDLVYLLEDYKQIDRS